MEETVTIAPPLPPRSVAIRLIASRVLMNTPRTLMPITSSIVSDVIVSSVPGGPMNPAIPDGQPGRWGDTTQQTNDVLTKLEGVLTKLGLTFGDVVKGTVFLVADPANGNKINFPAMNAEWNKRFGSATQPNKPARSTVQVGLATPGALVEIELVAVKKN